MQNKKYVCFIYIHQKLQNIIRRLSYVYVLEKSSVNNVHKLH